MLRSEKKEGHQKELSRCWALKTAGRPHFESV